MSIIISSCPPQVSIVLWYDFLTSRYLWPATKSHIKKANDLIVLIKLLEKSLLYRLKCSSPAGCHVFKSGRRGAYAPPPPCVRFRTRRFMLYIGVALVDLAVTRVHAHQSIAWTGHGSCAAPRRSTTDHVRWWPSATPAPRPVPAASGS